MRRAKGILKIHEISRPFGSTSSNCSIAEAPDHVVPSRATICSASVNAFGGIHGKRAITPGVWEETTSSLCGLSHFRSTFESRVHTLHMPSYTTVYSHVGQVMVAVGSCPRIVKRTTGCVCGKARAVTACSPSVHD